MSRAARTLLSQRFRLFPAVLALIAALLVTPAAAQEPVPGRIEGRLVSGTEGFAAPEGTRVQLIALAEDGGITTLETESATDGSFFFEPPADPSVTYIVRAVVEDVRSGVAPAVIAARFHNGLVDVLTRVAARCSAETGIETVALSGGVFQNVILLTRLTERLRAAGLRVLTHSRVPPNDAGISLGQVAVAAARDAPD